MYKLKNDIELNTLEKYGFRIFKSHNEIVYAVRDSVNDKCNLGQYYRIGINEMDRKFNKTKYRGGGKCLLSMSVTKNDILDLIQAGLIENAQK